MLKLVARVPLPLETSRPLMVVLVKNGPYPRIDVSDAPPFSRFVETPVNVDSASPIDSAGMSPISSAFKPSTISVEIRF